MRNQQQENKGIKYYLVTTAGKAAFFPQHLNMALQRFEGITIIETLYGQSKIYI